MALKENKHPKDEANFLSRFFFWWQLRLLLKKPVTDYVCVQDQESKCLGDELEAQWFQELKRKKPSLIRALFKMFGHGFTLQGLCYCPIDLIAIIFQSLYLGKLLEYFIPNQKTVSRQQVLTYGLIIASLSFLRVISLNYYTIQLSTIGLKVKIACSSLVYRKVLKMKTRNVTIGDVINLLSTDMDRFDRGFACIHFVWTTPVRLVFILAYLCCTYSYLAVTGASVLLLGMFFQIFVFKKLANYRREVADKSDRRIRLVNVLVSGIKAVKMYAWEKHFAKLVDHARRLEMTHITKIIHLRAMNSSVVFYLNKIAFFVCILSMVVAKQPLTSKYVFSLVAIYELLIYFIRLFVNGLPIVSEIMVGFQRIEHMLLLDEEQQSSIVQNHQQPIGVKACNMSVKWERLRVLDGVDVCVHPGELVAVVGVAGCGKSTLLQTILKEIEPDNGTINVGGQISYASQDPWIFSATIKENILFGEELDEERYSEVVRVCALDHDLSLFSHGDNSLVGERGVKLSGGQKSRINLARAVYRKADLYLLDDPLSAVDSRIAKHIYDECISNYLKDKCVVLVTHQTQFLTNVDRIYVIQNGKMRVENWNTTLQNLIENEAKTPVVKTPHHGHENEIEESSTFGTINPYKSYISAGGYKNTCVQILLFVAFQFIINLLDYILSVWSSIQESKTCLYIYSSLLVLLLILGNLNTFAFTLYSKKVSQKLHDLLFSNILKGSMHFFNNHSSGRILNRLSQDLGIIDQLLPFYIFDLTRYWLYSMGMIVLIIVVNYWMILPTLLLFGILYIFVLMFRSTVKKIKVTEAVRCSPIFTHVSSTMQGLTVIKALQAQEHMKSQFDDLQNVYSSIRYLFRAVYYSFSFWTEVICTLYIVFIVLLLLLVDDGENGGNIGLAISQSISFIGPAQYFIKMLTEVDMIMTSVERIVEYSDLEPEEDRGRFVPLDAWPSQGNISFRSVSMRYLPDKPLVLDQVTLNIKAGEKIGIIGRTGAGKSSLVSVLFRLFNFDGLVLIDDVNTKTVPLSMLRSRILTIPQEPVLFLGTLRQNLDPFAEFSHRELWNAFDEANLKQWTSSLSSGLETQVLEGGSNFSVGERQLLCLVRAILKKSQIVVLDEATASVDSETDELIQTTIKRKFKHATVLTIAHRLNTIMDSDKILVMEKGKVVEFDEPERLLQNPNNIFYKSVYQVK